MKGPNIENALSSWGILSSEKKLSTTTAVKAPEIATKEEDFFNSFDISSSLNSCNENSGQAEETSIKNKLQTFDAADGTSVSNDDWPDLNEVADVPALSATAPPPAEPNVSITSASLQSLNTSKSSSIIAKKKKS